MAGDGAWVLQRCRDVESRYRGAKRHRKASVWAAGGGALVALSALKKPNKSEIARSRLSLDSRSCDRLLSAENQLGRAGHDHVSRRVSLVEASIILGFPDV